MDPAHVITTIRAGRRIPLLPAPVTPLQPTALKLTLAPGALPLATPTIIPVRLFVIPIIFVGDQHGMMDISVMEVEIALFFTPTTRVLAVAKEFIVLPVSTAENQIILARLPLTAK